jgi:hypothetical protein
MTIDFDKLLADRTRSHGERQPSTPRRDCPTPPSEVAQLIEQLDFSKLEGEANGKTT